MGKNFYSQDVIDKQFWPLSYAHAMTVIELGKQYEKKWWQIVKLVKFFMHTANDSNKSAFIDILDRAYQALLTQKS